MGWTRCCRRTSGAMRTAKSRGPDPPTLPDAGIKSAGDDQQATEAIKPGTPGRACAQGMPDVPAESVVTAACFPCCKRAMGAACTRHSLRPLCSTRDTNDAELEGKSRRQNAQSHLPRCHAPA